jgi:hypothetical protein
MGEPLAEMPLAGPARLVPWTDGRLGCFEVGPRRESLLLERDAGALGGLRLRDLVAAEAATLAASDGERSLLGGPGPRLRELGPGGEELARSELGGPVLALDAAAARSGWWVLLGGSSAELLRLGPGLELRSSHELAGALLLCGAPGTDRAWLADPDGALLWCVGPSGPELAISDPELADVTRLIGLPGGGLLALAPGALLRFDDRGNPLPGQGGFSFLVDAALARPSEGADRRLEISRLGADALAR